MKDTGRKTGKARKSVQAPQTSMTRQELARAITKARAQYAALPPEMQSLVRLLTDVHERLLFAPVSPMTPASPAA